MAKRTVTTIVVAIIMTLSFTAHALKQWAAIVGEKITALAIEGSTSTSTKL